MTHPPIESTPSTTPTPDHKEGQPPVPERRKSRKLAYGLIGGVAGAAVIAGSIMGIEAAAGPKKDDHESSASSAPSHTPDASPTPVETDQPITVESLEIKTGLTPEQLGTALVDRLSSWDMAGATAKNRDAYYAEGSKTGNADAYTSQLADTNGDIYAEALFGPDWQSVSGLATYVPNKEKNNADFVGLWFKTSAGVSKLDREPFKSSDTVESVTVVSQTGDSVTERILTVAHNNASANRADTLAPGTAALDGEQFVVVATFTNANGVERVSGFDIVKP